MAWDQYEVGDLELISGDIVFDELHGAVKRIRIRYLERFGRNPYLAELLYTLCRIAGYASPSVVEDSPLPLIENILSSLTIPTHLDQIEAGHYRGGFNDECELLIWPKKALPGSTVSGTPVLRVQVEDHRPEEVLCRYSTLSSDITDTAARCLIRLCVLRDLLHYNILDPGLVVRFEKE